MERTESAGPVTDGGGVFRSSSIRGRAEVDIISYVSAMFVVYLVSQLQINVQNENLLVNMKLRIPAIK